MKMHKYIMVSKVWKIGFNLNNKIGKKICRKDFEFWMQCISLLLLALFVGEIVFVMLLMDLTTDVVHCNLMPSAFVIWIGPKIITIHK